MNENALILPKIRPKQVEFCNHYHQTGNATKSAIQAGYSPKTARQMGSENLTKPVIIKYLSVLIEERKNKHEAIFNTVIERTDDVTRRAETADDKAIELKGLDQLSKLGGLYTADDRTKDPQVWTGIEIDYGDGTLKVVTGTGSIKEGPPEKSDRL